ncbi:MAG: Sigma-70, region 4 [Bryobacterales bacterium]|nr:Sigma-70, region 4 [Bryobacterales bacterium]
MLPKRDAAIDYRRLLAALASRARWLGSQDPEGAAQEALRRSLENASSQPAVEYYFSQDLPAGLQPPEWPLDQLFAWLHGVVHYIVREEHNRVSNRREVPIGGIRSERSDDNSHLDPADPAPDALDALIEKELQGIVVDCFPMLDREYQTVLRMRVDGLTYGQIALRLGVNENTIATWVSRGIRALAQCVRRRTERFTSPRSAGARNTG